MTDTAPYADVVLPATTFLEHYDIAKGYGAYHLHLVQPVIAPVGESRPNHEVFRELGVRLGLAERGDELGEAGALMDAAARLPDAHAAGDARRTRRAGAGRRPAGPVRRRACRRPPDGRVHLFPADAGEPRPASTRTSPIRRPRATRSA